MSFPLLNKLYLANCIIFCLAFFLFFKYQTKLQEQLGFEKNLSLLEQIVRSRQKSLIHAKELRNQPIQESICNKLEVAQLLPDGRKIDKFYQGAGRGINFPLGGRFDELTSREEYYGYQTGEEYVAWVSPLPDSSVELSMAEELAEVDQEEVNFDVKYKGRLINIRVQNKPIRYLISKIAELANLKIIYDSEVTDSISIKLFELPWDQALDVVAAVKNLKIIFEGKDSVTKQAIYRIISSKSEDKQESLKQLKDNYGQAEDISTEKDE